MAKSQTNQGTTAAGNLIDQGKGVQGPGGLMSTFQRMMGGAGDQQSQEYGSAYSGISGAQTTGGYDPAQLKLLQGETQDLANTGGYNATDTTTLKSGGYDPTQLAAIQGGYGDLAKTGGFTPEQEQQFMRQATEGTAATGDILSSQLARSRAATGGLGAGGEASQMARQLEQTQAKGTLDAEVGLNERETANKLAGLGGLSSSAADVAGKTLQGTEAVNASKLAGTNMQAGLAANQAAGVNTANSQMSQLFNTTTNQITNLGQQILESLGLSFSSQESAINALVGLSKNPGFLQTLMGDIGGIL